MKKLIPIILALLCITAIFSSCKAKSDNGQKTPQDGNLTVDGLEYALLENGNYYVKSANANCPSVVTIPAKQNGKAVTHVGNTAFLFCTHITSVTLSEGITHIGSGAFSTCDSLQTITLPESVTFIGKGAFDNCVSLTAITLPGSVKSIGEAAFYMCHGLESATLSHGIESIGEAAFYACSSLASVTVPSSVTKIEAGVFAGCHSLGTITFGGTKAQWEAIEKGDAWNEDTGNYTVFCTDGELTK